MFKCCLEEIIRNEPGRECQRCVPEWLIGADGVVRKSRCSDESGFLMETPPHRPIRLLHSSPRDPPSGIGHRALSILVLSRLFLFVHHRYLYPAPFHPHSHSYTPLIPAPISFVTRPCSYPAHIWVSFAFKFARRSSFISRPHFALSPFRCHRVDSPPPFEFRCHWHLWLSIETKMPILFEAMRCEII
jgi:hypothetical protein